MDDEKIQSSIRWCLNYTGNLSLYFMSYKCSKVELNLTTCKLLQTASELETINSLCNASEIIWNVIFWFSTIVGIIGNSLAMITVASLPVSTATFYIGVLSLSDLTAIIVHLIIFFLHKYRILNPTVNYWDIFPLLFDFTASYSNWLLVLVCFERLITIRYPLQKRYYFTTFNARISAIVLGLVLFAVYNICAWNIGYTDMRMFTIRNLLYAVIPLILILNLIVLIAISMRIIHKNRKVLHERTLPMNKNCGQENNQNSPASSELTHIVKKIPKRRSVVFMDIARMENTITIMMVVAAVCFALLTIPGCIHLFLYTHASHVWNTPVTRAQWHVFSKIAQALSTLNLAINFLLYFLSAKKFRTQLWKVLRCQTKQKPEVNIYTAVNYSVTEM